MPRRTQIFQQLPWTGGVNTSVDPGFIPPNELVQADNVVFATSGSRLKREGFSYIGTALPAVTHRSSSGTTRTLVFADSLVIASPAEDLLHVGEDITIASTGTGDDLLYAVTETPILTITTTTNTNDTITYTGTSSLTEGSTATSTITANRAHSLIDVQDYWRVDSTGDKAELLMAVSSQGKIYEYDTSDRRTLLGGQEEVFSIVADAQADHSAAGDGGKYITFNSANNATGYYGWFDVSGSDTDPAVGGRTGVEWDISGDTTEADVAATIKAAIDGISGTPFTTALATTNVSNDTVVVTAATAGITTDAANVDVTAAAFAVTKTTDGATLPTSDLTKSDSIIFNGRYIVAFEATGDLPVRYRPEVSSKYELLANGSAPDFSFATEYLARIWTNDKTNKDRIHYSATGNQDSWLGTSDSGALDISPDDGDEEGITAIFPFKGRLFVAKGSRLFQIDGNHPLNFRIIPISNGIGIANHKAVAAVDQDDVLFVSKKGIHTLGATSNFGDFESKFLSAKIQPTFNSFNPARLKFTHAAYFPEINSVAFGVAEKGEAEQKNVWLYNTIFQAWYRWPNTSCESLATKIVGDRIKLIMGTSDGRIVQAQNDTFTDFGNIAIAYRIRTGAIYPGGNPQTMKGFKKLGFLFKPEGDYTFTVNFAIDNFGNQPRTYRQEAQGDELGSEFVLGQSVLGVNNVMAPFTQTIEGHGRGCSMDITQTGTNEQVEIYAFMIEYEDEDLVQETVSGSGGT